MPRSALRRALAPLLLLAVLGAWALAAPATATADAGGADATTAAAVDEILADVALPSAVWGILAVDAETGRVVVSRGANGLLLPASTLKLFTTAAALDALGPDFRFTTGLYHLGTTEGGTLRGDLVIRGSADPTFGTDGMDGLGNPLSRWAEALAAAGVRRVEGRIIGDDDRTDDEPYPEGWDVTHVTTETYAPAIGGLTYADNLLGLRVENGRVEASPDGFATVRRETARRAESRDEGEADTPRERLSIRRALGSDEFLVSGSTTGRASTVQVPVANPTRYAVHAFAARLAAAGIDVSGATLWDVDDLDRKPVYGTAEPLLASVSPTLARIVEHTNKESDNLYAEHLLRALTPEGSAAAGVARVRALLARAGAEHVADLSLMDGSGLSRKDLITPSAMVALLRYMRTQPAAPAFLASLPTGGGAGSTLRNRLDGVPVRAKTGSIAYARCLSGYVTGPDGRLLVFSVMANNYTAQGSRITGAMDGIVRALATGRRPDTTVSADGDD